MFHFILLFFFPYVMIPNRNTVNNRNIRPLMILMVKNCKGGGGRFLDIG